MGATPGDSEFSVLPLQALPDAASLGEQRLRRLLNRAELTNPRIRADQAQYLSALAHAEAVRDQGLPTVKLAWQYSHSTQPVIEGLGLPAFGASTRDNNVAIEVQIPLFDGWAQRDREQEASAQAQEQLAALDLTRQKVIQQVWSADQSYSEAADDVRMRQRVANLASQALRAARKRYRHGVASVLEVLNAQAALVHARAQQIDASRRWLLARLNLAYAVGDLGTSPGLFGARALDALDLGER